jgi:hypothetical protein
MDSEADEAERLTALKQRLDRLTLAIKTPGTSPQLPKQSADVEKVTLAAIACSWVPRIDPRISRKNTADTQHRVTRNTTDWY